MLISVVSAKGAPGVSVSALAWTLMWRGPALLVEAEPRGGEFLVGWAHSQAGQGRDLLSAYVASRRATPMDVAIRDQAVALSEDRWLLAGFPEPQQAAAMDWTRLARACSGMQGLDVIADCGAVTAVNAPRQMWSAADLVVLVVRATAPGVRAAQLVLPRLRSDLAELGLGADRLGVVVVGAGRPYSVGEVQDALNPKDSIEPTPVIADLPLDPKVAAFLSSGVKTLGTKPFDGSRFAGHAKQSGAALAAQVDALRERAAALHAFQHPTAPVQGGAR